MCQKEEFHMKHEEMIAAKCFKFETKYHMNKLGLILLDQKEMQFFNMSDLDKSYFFGPIDDQTVFSRGTGYYNSSITPHILCTVKHIIETAIKQKCITILYSLYEFILSHFSIIWYKLYFNQKFSVQNTIMKLYQQLSIVAKNLINVISDEMVLSPLDWDFLAHIAKNAWNENDTFRIPEYDNKIEIVKEICWLINSGIVDTIDGILFPMMGALNLMILASTMLDKTCYPVNIGFHDNIIHQTENFSDYIPYASNILILDDNIGSGKTITECRKRLEKLGCNSFTRVCEIPWDIVSRLNDYSIINNCLDIPTIKSNLRNLSKNIFIQRIRNSAYNRVFEAKHLFIHQEEEINMMESRISLFEEMQIFPLAQIERLRSELVFYKNAYNIGGQYV